MKPSFLSSFSERSGSLKDLLITSLGDDFDSVVVALLAAVDAPKGEHQKLAEWHETRGRAQSILHGLGLPVKDAGFRVEVVKEYGVDERGTGIAKALLTDQGFEIVESRHTFLYSRLSSEEIRSLKAGDANRLRNFLAGMPR
jgi:hypothetical protein